MTGPGARAGLRRLPPGKRHPARLVVAAFAVALLVSRRLGLRMQLSTQTETRALDLGEVRRVSPTRTRDR